MSDTVTKKSVAEGIGIIKLGLSIAGIGFLGDAMNGDAHAMGASEAYADAIEGLNAFLADLEAA